MTTLSILSHGQYHAHPRLAPFFSTYVPPTLPNTPIGCLATRESFGMESTEYPTKKHHKFIIPSYTILLGGQKNNVKNPQPAKVGTGGKSETQPSATCFWKITPKQRKQGSLSGQALKGFNLGQGQKFANMGELKYVDV